MSTYFVRMSTGHKGQGAKRRDYIAREKSFSGEKIKQELVVTEDFNLPSWVKNGREFFEATESVAFIIQFFCGLRVGELLALTINDIDLANNTIKISKTYKRFQGKDLISPPKTRKSRRTISIPAVVKNALTDYLNKTPVHNSNDRIFKMISYNSLQRAIHSEAKLIGLKNIRVHDLRHSCISMLANAGCDITQIREYMGHSKISMTLDTYTHLYPNRFDEITSKIDKISESLTFDEAMDKPDV